MENLSNWTLRPAGESDVPALQTLIPLSVRGLQATHYTPAQMDRALGPIFGVDRQLISDGTYYVAVDAQGQVVACGGWSKRRALFGGDTDRSTAAGTTELLDPTRDRARVRAFFVHPDHARRGIGRAILEECERAIRAHGFAAAELVATLAGEPLYSHCGYVAEERFNIPMADGLSLPVVRMGRRL